MTKQNKLKSEDKRRQSQMEDILEFCVELSAKLIGCGANLERVQLAVQRICESYDLTEVSMELLSTYCSIGARDPEGRYASRQINITENSIHLERLKNLNRLSYDVVEHHPLPERLNKMLEDALQTTEDYRPGTVLCFQIAAMSCL